MPAHAGTWTRTALDWQLCREANMKGLDEDASKEVQGTKQRR
jgi:hypothetical protein